MKTKVTIKDVAAEAGVSPGAVSAVLNGRSGNIGVSEQTRARVLEAVRRTGYHANPQARSLRAGRTQIIGAALDDITVPFLADLIHHTGRALHARGFGLMLFDLDALNGDGMDAVALFASGRADALLLAGATRQVRDADILKLAAAGLPVVLLERPAPDPDIRTVQTDNAAGGRLALRHLAERGCERFAFITGPADNPMSADRLRGAREVLAAPRQEIACLAGDWSLASGFHCMTGLLKTRRRRPDAIFAFNDSMAIGALKAIREAGLRPGADIAVVGFDDIPLAAYSDPPLTTVRQPAAEMGQLAAALLLDAAGADPAGLVPVVNEVSGKIRSGKRATFASTGASSVGGKDDRLHVICQPELIVRNSTEG